MAGGEGMTLLRELLNDEEVIQDALAVLKIGIEKGDQPAQAFRLAVASVLTRWLPDAPPHFRGHDERVALANRLMREFIVPLLPKGEGALLLLYPFERGTVTYVSSGERAGCRIILRDLLAKWDADAAERGEP
jgi:hypothetical protein